jgi:DNA-binding transcriptional LysR family regulator
MNLSRLDLTSLRLALACARTGSLTAAAHDLHLAPAAASRRLKELEATLGSVLFERHARGLRVTSAGEVVVRHGLALLHSLERLGHEVTDLREGHTRHVRLCTSTAALNQFLPPLLARFAERHPEIRVDLEEQVTTAVVSALREGRCDLGIFVEGPSVDELTPNVFAHDELVLVLPRSHPLARQRKPIPFESVLDQDLIGMNPGAALLQSLQSSAEQRGVPLRLRMQVRSFDAVCHLVAAGLGISVLPRAAVEPLAQAMGLTCRPLTDGWARRRLLIAAGAGRQEDEAVRILLSHLTAQPDESSHTPTAIHRARRTGDARVAPRSGAASRLGARRERSQNAKAGRSQ